MSRAWSNGPSKYSDMEGEEAGVPLGKIRKVFPVASEAELAGRTYAHSSRVMEYHVYS